MIKLIKSAAIASLCLLVIGCSSDDNSQKQPEGPKFEDQYFLSTVLIKNYYEDEKMNEDGTIETIIRLINNRTYNFKYDEAFNLKTIASTYNSLNNGEVQNSANSKYTFTLNDKNQLTFFEVETDEGAYPTYKHTYTYKDNLLDKVNYSSKFSTYDQLFTYNTLKQFSKSTIADRDLVLEYSYNTKNQLTEIKEAKNTQPTVLQYDAKNTPFKYLPLDLTTHIFNEIEYLPYTYILPNNITYIKASDDLIFKMEYTYNEAGYPISVKTFTDDEGHIFMENEIEYTYTVNRIEIKE